MNFRIEPAEYDQAFKLHHLYRKVALSPNGLIRRKDEITKDYIDGFMYNSLKNGLILVGTDDDDIIGEIHAYTPGIYAFQHILTDLTIVVDPVYQGKGVGRNLFEKFLEIVKTQYHHILRIELFVREHNIPIVKFYESLGFKNEGRQEFKIYSSESGFETPLHMAWFNADYMGHRKSGS